MKAKTITNFLSKVTLITLFFLSFTAVSQDEKPKNTLEKLLSKVSLSGSIDGYFRHNFGAPNDNTIAPRTFFVDESGFALGMANTILSYDDENVGFVADLVFGPRGRDAVFNSDESAQIINQLYVYWNVTKNVKLTFGNFNTYIGYEMITPTENFNYSTSYMFTYGPLSHTGLKADFSINEKWSAMVSVMNPSDYTENNPFDTYIVGAQLGYEVDRGNAYLNFRYGNEGKPGEVGPTFQVDLTTGWNLTEDFNLGVNTTYVTTEPQENGDTSGFYGVALYPQYKTSEKFSIGLRGEYFSVYNNGLTDVIGLDSDGDGNVIATTLTGNYNIGPLTLKPELRLDATSEDFFINNDREATKSLSSFVLGAVYKF
ncbi:porin [Aquimarina sediminis]|uniref:porin n=1 Tax=Aquimarina sediminis TaxID=2070536 RepID=UPI000CA059FE|nr:porin [Aquimarina sediminis]